MVETSSKTKVAGDSVETKPGPIQRPPTPQPKPRQGSQEK